MGDDFRRRLPRRYVVANGYSGQKFYTEGGIQFYNIIFTIWPILFLGCFDRDVTLEDTNNFPRLYILGINDVFFNAKVIGCRASRAGGLCEGGRRGLLVLATA